MVKQQHVARLQSGPLMKAPGVKQTFITNAQLGKSHLNIVNARPDHLGSRTLSIFRVQIPRSLKPSVIDGNTLKVKLADSFFFENLNPAGKLGESHLRVVASEFP